MSCMSGSRPRPGPMTRTWRRGSMSIIGAAMVEAEADKEEEDCCIKGWTIRFGE